MFPAPTEKRCLEMYERDEIAGQIVDSVVEEALYPLPTFWVDEEKGKRELPELKSALEEVVAFDSIKYARRLIRVFKYSLIHLIFDDEEMETEPTASARLVSTEIIMPDRVTKIDKDKDQHSPLFNRPEYYHISKPDTKVLKRLRSVKVHRSRMLEVRADGICPDRPLPLLIRLHDTLHVKKNQDWAWGQLPWKYAAGFNIMYVPKSSGKGFVKKMRESWYPSNNNCYVFKQNERPEEKFDVKHIQPSGGVLDPTPFTDRIFKQLSGGSAIPDVILTGTHAGAVTGSEVNTRDWMKTVMREATLGIQPILMILADLLNKHNNVELPVGWYIKFSEVWQLNELEKAEIKRVKYLAESIKANTVLKLTQAGFDVEFDDEGEVVILGKLEPQTPAAEPQANASCGHDHTKKNAPTPAYQKWYMPMQKLEAEAVLKSKIEANKSLARWIKDTEPIISAVAATDENLRQNILPPEILALIGKLGIQSKPLQAVIGASMLNTMDATVDHTVAQLQLDVVPDAIPWSTSDPAAASFVESNSLLAIEHGWKPDMEAAMKHSLIEGLQKGKGPDETATLFKERLTGEMSDAFKGEEYRIDRIVRTELARAQNEARVNTYEKNGITEVEFIPNPDACPICVDLAGVYPTSEGRGLIPGQTHPNCECTTQPVPPADLVPGGI